MSSNFSFDTAQDIGNLRNPKSIQVSTRQSDRPQFFTARVSGRSSIQATLRRLKGTVDITVFDSDRQKLTTARNLTNTELVGGTVTEGEYFLKVTPPSTRGRFRLDLFAERVTAPDPETALLVGLTRDNQLAFFNDDNPTNVTKLSVTGLQDGESLLGIDFRPNTGQLFGLGSSNRLYTLNTSTGAATSIGDTFAVPLNGTSFGFDFNPTVDRIRVVSDAGQNLRLNPDTGAVVDADLVADGIQTDGALNGATTSIMATAYTNSFAGATTTTQYGIDATTNQLFIQNPPNAGTQTLVGDLNFDVGNGVGFDIFSLSTAMNVGIAASKFFLFSINLETGAASFAGSVLDQLKPLPLKGFAVRPLLSAMM